VVGELALRRVFLREILPLSPLSAISALLSTHFSPHTLRCAIVLTYVLANPGSLIKVLHLFDPAFDWPQSQQNFKRLDNNDFRKKLKVYGSVFVYLQFHTRLIYIILSCEIVVDFEFVSMWKEVFV
jgi:hypothetical protein